MDFSGLAQVGAQATYAARAPVHKPPEVMRIDKSDASSKSGADPRQASQNEANSADAQRILSRLTMVSDMEKPAGPPPSFEISLLEMEQSLHNTLARMEVSRGQERDAAGIRPYSEPSGSVQAPDANQNKMPEMNPAQMQQATNKETGIVFNGVQARASIAVF